MTGFRGVERQVVTTDVSGARTGPTVVPDPGSTLPLRMMSRSGSDVIGWAASNADDVTSWLDVHGALLFSGLPVDQPSDVAAVVAGLAGAAQPYLERSTPRTELAPGVYTATDYPADQDIPLHNENAYQSVAPSRLVFCCLRPAASGGATVIADCRAVLRRLDARIIEQFTRRGVSYLRNYIPGLGPSWQESFQTADRAAVQAYCSAHSISMEWRGDVLRTSQRRAALARHRRTGEPVWFNHALIFHPTSLAAEVADPLIDQYGVDGLPVQSRYGDGGQIEPDVIAEIRAAYGAESVPIAWQAGDVLLVDNQLVAHGRSAFTGTRQVVVSMTGQISNEERA